MSEVEQIPAIPVHLASAEPGVQLGQAAEHAPRHHSAVPHSVILTSDEPAKQLLQPDPNRENVVLFAFTNAVVLSGSKGDAQAAGNVAATITNPNGTMIPAGIMVPLGKLTSELWVSTGTYPTIVSVFPVYRR